MNLDSYTKAQTFDLSTLESTVANWRTMFDSCNLEIAAWIPDDLNARITQGQTIEQFNKLVCFAYERLQQSSKPSEDLYLSVFVKPEGEQIQIWVKDSSSPISQGEVEGLQNWVGVTSGELAYQYDPDEGNQFSLTVGA